MTASAATVSVNNSASNLRGRWPQPPAAPMWMVWVPYAAVLWALAYGAVRVWWAIRGAPSFGPLHYDLLFFAGWKAVILCVAALAVAVALRLATWHRVLWLSGCGVCVSMLAACPLLLLDAVGATLPHLAAPLQPVAFLSRFACLVEAIFVGAVTVAYRRRWRSACLFCGRTERRKLRQKPPQWAWIAAYAAVAGCLVRLAAQVGVGFGMMQRPGSGTRVAIEVFVFEAAFLLAGTVLPLALVHSWGRVVPRRVPLLAGMRVPRWLALGPASVIGGLMTVYFAITLIKVAIDTFSGAWHQSFGPFPLAFFWVAVPAYLVWGLGLSVAAVSFGRITRPACKECGRP